MSTAQETAIKAKSAPVWLVRAGARGEDEAVALEHSLAILGFDGVADLTNASNTEAVRERVRKANPEAQAAKIRNVASQLSAFALRMHEGDVVVLPLKTRQGQIALGRVDGPYRYQDVEGVKRHTRSIRWIRPGVPRQEFEQDLLYSLGAFMTVCRIQRHGAEQRIAAMLEGGPDPGDGGLSDETGDSEGDEESDRDEDKTPNISEFARQQILEHVRSNFLGHEFARLVESVLQAEGYFTLRSSAGRDGGVDILAGRGSLGFDGPRLCVQVKATAGTVDVTVLRSLMGTMQSFKADRGLLVSWGGFTSEVEREARQGFFSVRLWHADNLVDAICRNYERLPEQIQKEVPLERVWTLVPDKGDS